MKLFIIINMLGLSFYFSIDIFLIEYDKICSSAKNYKEENIELNYDLAEVFPDIDVNKKKRHFVLFVRKNIKIPAQKIFYKKQILQKRQGLLIFLTGNVSRYVSIIKNIKSLKYFTVRFGILWKIIFFMIF